MICSAQLSQQNSSATQFLGQLQFSAHPDSRRPKQSQTVSQSASSAEGRRSRKAASRHQTGSSSILHRNRTMLALVLGLSLVCSFSAQIPVVAGLACYETVNGKTTIVQNDSWTYCALVPATIVGNELINGSQFGLGPENDMLSMYNSAFSMSQDEYRILTVCIYERYDFSRFMTIKPDLAVEFAFRCVCNYDLCNSEPTFSAYLSAIKSESFARR